MFPSTNAKSFKRGQKMYLSIFATGKQQISYLSQPRLCATQVKLRKRHNLNCQDIRKRTLFVAYALKLSFSRRAQFQDTASCSVLWAQYIYVNIYMALVVGLCVLVVFIKKLYFCCNILRILGIFWTNFIFLSMRHFTGA